MRIDFVKEFTDMPGARYPKQGKYSGEEFRTKILDPKYRKAKEMNEVLEIDLDGAYGFPPSFLEEAFGGLARIHEEDDPRDIINRLKIISFDEPGRIDRINKYIEDTRE